MTPAQKTTLDARQSIDRIDQLVRWLERNRQVVDASEAGLASALRMISLRYRGIESAVEQPPAIALVSEWAGLRAQMVGALTSPQTPPSETELKHNEAEILRRLLLRSASADRTVAIRYRAGEASSPPRDHPFRVTLLGIADLAAIMAGVYQICFPGGTPTQETLTRMSEIHKEVAAKVQPATVSGLGEWDVLWLQETLERQFPAAPGLRLLAAAGYWRDLADVAAHIPVSERVRALSLLWSDQPQLTALFKDMVLALTDLGFSTEAFCAREALMERDASSGWFVLHPDSIITAATLQQLASRNGKTVRIVGRYGHPATMTRAMLAALASEVTLETPSGAMASLAAADVLDFPAIGMPGDLAVEAPRGHRARRSAHARPDLAQLLQVFAHVKTRHLLDSACRSHDVTCMVACVENSRAGEGALPHAVGDWIELSHGSEPHQRERSSIRLFVVAESIEAGPASGASDTDAQVARAQALARHVRRSIAGAMPWLGQWTPAEPFANTFTVRLDKPSAAQSVQAARTGSVLAVAVPQAAPDPEPDLPLTPIGTRHDAQRLLDAVAGVSSQSMKERELRRQLDEMHKRVRSRLLRYSTDPDDAERDDWRRRIAVVLGHRIHHLARRRRLGFLLASLRIGEPQLIAIYRRSELAALDARTRPPARQLVEFDDEVEKSTHAAPARVPRQLSMTLAHAVVAHWLESLRQLARAERYCRQIEMPGWMVEHLVDELGIGAVRLGLVRRVAEVIENFVARTHAGETAFASVVAAVLHGFIERLDIEGGAAGRVSTAAVIEHTEQPDATDAVLAMKDRPFSDRWSDAFSRFIEANIATARFWSAGQAGSDLARLLSEFPQIRLEVEP